MSNCERCDKCNVLVMPTTFCISCHVRELVVPLSMECLSAVLNNEYMDKQLEAIQAAIMTAIVEKSKP